MSMLPYHSPAPILYQVPQSNYASTKGNHKRSPLSNHNDNNGKPKSNSFSASRDSEWLTLEICREFLRGTCPREELTCRYAHPSKNIYCNNSRVVCCYDYIKGRCHRYQPPCKYLHPPNHLKEQLLQNGKANLMLKNMQVIIAPNHKNTVISRANSTGSYQLAPLPLSSHGYHQSQIIDVPPTVNNLHSLSYISPVPYFFVSTQDNQSLRNVIQPSSPNPSIPSKSITRFNYAMTQNQSFNDSILANHLPMPQYFYSNMFGAGNQIFVKNWPLCTYTTVPY